MPPSDAKDFEPIIRPMRPEDRPAAIDLLANADPWRRLGYTSEDWDRIFAPIPQNRETYVIECGSVFAGLAVVRQKFLIGDYLELLGIAEGAQDRGLGTRLLAHVESIVFARTKNLFACVSEFNEPARRFYARHGYREIGPIPDLLITGATEILLRKTTGPAREGHP
jgi:ribosomal protein S18 acetylase RimI-like enzyme